ncbi:DUF397 domain-containing protein [Streptomyces sp. NPDC093065]|uniref:DUF397 domain-containing protein n=1 Tax=Streptomyces sp. NPDC093065 TaxID=3366021 RepID=UPI003819EBA6
MNWRKSTYSGGGEGNTCVEIAESVTRIVIRDSKVPARATLSVAVPAFAAFVEGVKRYSR